MRQCLYISTAANLADADVEAILEASLRNNARDEITGFLLYNGRNFMQLIEGPEARLQDLLLRLASDKRHQGVVLMLNEPIEERCCPDWSMTRITLAEDLAERRRGLDAQLPASLQHHVHQAVSNFALLN